jgi:hypothetical protein
MKLNRNFTIPMSWVENAPLLWKFIADLGAVVVAAAAVVMWTICFGRDDITMEWEAKGITHPDLRRAYRIRLPAAW